MTRKEISQVIESNDGKALYASQNIRASFGAIIGVFTPTSKSRMLKKAKLITEVRYGTYAEMRPDLDPTRITNGDQHIVVFVGVDPPA